MADKYNILEKMAQTKVIRYKGDGTKKLPVFWTPFEGE